MQYRSNSHSCKEMLRSKLTEGATSPSSKRKGHRAQNYEKILSQ